MLPRPRSVAATGSNFSDEGIDRPAAACVASAPRSHGEDEMKVRLLPVLVAAVTIALGVPGVAQAAPQDFTVNVTSDHDDGSCDAWTVETDCTLREAINAA